MVATHPLTDILDTPSLYAETFLRILNKKKKKVLTADVDAKQAAEVAADQMAVASLPPGYSVQVSAFNSKQAATDAIIKMRGAAPQDFKGKKAFTVAVKKKGALEYRVVIAGLSSKVAKQSCAKISKTGKTCAVILPQV